MARWTDAEVWGVLAESIAGSGVVSVGLCAAIWWFYVHDLISDTQMQRLRKQLYGEFGYLAYGDYGGFFWERYAINPRIAACRRLCQMACRNSG